MKCFCQTKIYLQMNLRYCGRILYQQNNTFHQRLFIWHILVYTRNDMKLESPLILADMNKPAVIALQLGGGGGLLQAGADCVCISFLQLTSLGTNTKTYSQNRLCQYFETKQQHKKF
jgi:hypothetical protein